MSAALCGTSIDLAVANAIDMMRSDLLCEAGIESLAHQNFYSKFHFTREFGRITGTTPRRYLAALRMERAKRYLLDTPKGIAEIGHLVGYSSVGTFSSRFAQLVGMPPSTWREKGGSAAPIVSVRGPGLARCVGQLTFPDSVDIESCAMLSVGAFADSIVQGAPVASARVDFPGTFQLEGLPVGAWTVVVRSEETICAATAGFDRRRSHLSLVAPLSGAPAIPSPPPSPADHPAPLPGPGMYGFGPMIITEAGCDVRLRITARRTRPTDPPVLFAGPAA